MTTATMVDDVIDYVVH